MSISSFTTVLMLDCRNAPMTIAVPKSTDILNRVITFKDLYGSSITNNITLSTYNGDKLDNYWWGQTVNDVSVQLEIPEGTKPKNLDVKITPTIIVAKMKG